MVIKIVNKGFFRVSEVFILYFFIETFIYIYILEVYSQSVGLFDVSGDDCFAFSFIIVSRFYFGICFLVCLVEYFIEEDQLYLYVYIVFFKQDLLYMYFNFLVKRR